MSWGGRPDEYWLEKAGRLEWLVLRCDKRMLKVKAERDTIIREGVGIIFLTTGQEHPPTILIAATQKVDRPRIALGHDSKAVRSIARLS